MNILKVIHGYPPLYNAGSEVYSQTLCRGLIDQHKVTVLSREEDPFKPAFSSRITCDDLDRRIPIHLINIPSENFRYSYRNQLMDDYCQQLIDQSHFVLVHIGHLNHLSLSLLEVFARNQLPVVYTLHDYWLICPRGQFIKRNPKDNKCWQMCHQQIDQVCASDCYAGYFSGADNDRQADLDYWSGWISRRMEYVRQVIHHVDIFIAPSTYLQQRYNEQSTIPSEKMIYLDYGFDLNRLKPVPEQMPTRQAVTFGYIGTHIPAKGIQQLIEAFGQCKGDACLKIWGRPRGYNTASLKRLVDGLPNNKSEQISWHSEYANEHIMQDVFQHIDCLVVPSIWVENSPLVIHEALQARVPVITANIGGMAEYVQHEVNGLLFEHRDANDLAKQMQRVIDEPACLKKLGEHGYLSSTTGDIPNLSEHIQQIETIYHNVLTKRMTV